MGAASDCTLEALRDRQAHSHDHCCHDESIVFPRTVDDENATVESQYYRRGGDDCEADSDA